MCMCVLFVICTQRRLLAVSTVIDNCAWAVSNVHVDLPTLANWRLCSEKIISQADQHATRFVFFSFLLPPFIACIELVSLGFEATKGTKAKFTLFPLYPLLRCFTVL